MPQRRRPRSNRGGHLLKDWRLKEGAYLRRKGPRYTQRELAMMLTVDSAHVSNWENGRIRPGPQNRVKLYDLAKIPHLVWDKEDDEGAPARAAG